MATDWKDALGALRASLPEEEHSEVSPATDNTEDHGKPARKEKLHISVERKGRGGKTATIVDGFLCDDDELQELARRLKQRIGTGGSARGGEILLQGEWREKTAELLRAEGYIVKG